MLGDLLEQYDASAAGDIVRRVAGLAGRARLVGRPCEGPVLLDRLLVVEDRLAPLDRSQVASAAASRETVLLRVLLHLARDHISSGRRHPWGNGVTPRAVAASLAAAAGVEPDAHAWAAAEDLDSGLRRPGDAEPAWDAPLGGDSAAMSYAELVDQTRLLAARVAEQDAHVVWLIDAVQRRQRWLRRTRATLRQLRQSREHRLARKLLVLRLLRDRLRPGTPPTAQRVTGIWFEREDHPDDDGLVHVERQLLPPGYTPHERVVVEEPGVDPYSHRVE